MSSISPDSIAQRHRRDLAQLNRRKKRLKRLLIALGLVALILMVRLFGQIESQGAGERLQQRFQEYSQSGAPNQWAYDFLAQERDLSAWLQRYGISLEVAFFDSISEVLFHNGLSIPESRPLSFFSRVTRSFQFGLMQVVFLVLASWRLCVAGILLMGIYQFFHMKRHAGTDLLGETGNNRLFYSGIRVGLEKLNAAGIPSLQVTGLACPDFRAPADAKNSAIGKVLAQYGADNQTNIRLAGIILAHYEWPAYVASKEEAPLLDSMFEGSTLGDKVTFLLQELLSAQERYRNKKYASSDDTSVDKPVAPGKKQTMEVYARRVRIAAERVLTHEFRVALGTLSAAQLASLILGLEAGAVLAIENHSGLWIRRSNFSQLCGRAILHSVPYYGSEYGVDERTTIRRALVYGSRMSVFAPVRFPLDFSVPDRAARQWVELLMACPHELEQVADEVEQVALVYEAHEAWGKAFFETIGSLPNEMRNEIFATHSNLFLMPLVRVIGILRRVVPMEVIRRLETLGNLIHQRSRLKTLAHTGDDSVDKSSRVLEAKTPPPLTLQEMKELSSQHHVSVEDIRDWSALRVVLTSYGWLARRVGDYTVPQSSLIFAVMRESLPHPEANAHGLVGRKGMVAFRATRLFERWGKGWTSQFCEMESASMAENLERYEKLLSGSVEGTEAGDSGSGGTVMAG